MTNDNGVTYTVKKMNLREEMTFCSPPRVSSSKRTYTISPDCNIPLLCCTSRDSSLVLSSDKVGMLNPI